LILRSTPRYPEIAIREITANALIHQDFTVTGSGPLIEMYLDRIEVTNPGNSLIPPDRLLDERRSRNEKLASLMRDLNICEERGSGLDKAMIEIEELHLPAPEFVSSSNSMRVVLFWAATLQ
jgi:ATP-dependent DNA helicase RecG